MIERVARQSQIQQIPDAGKRTAAGGFAMALQTELAKAGQDVQFSKHAMSRAEERGIEITPGLIDQIKGSMVRAQAKGATNILAMDTEKAFIINVPHGHHPGRDERQRIHHHRRRRVPVSEMAGPDLRRPSGPARLTGPGRRQGFERSSISL